MANLKELRTRIASVKSTRKITSAMSRIAAARLRKAQEAAFAARPYGERLQEIVSRLVAQAGDLSEPHPLMVERPVKRVLCIVLTADRGLCGGFNSNVNRAAKTFVERHRSEGHDVRVVAVGKKGQSFLRYRGVDLESSYDAPTLTNVVELARTLRAESVGRFLAPAEGRDAVFLIYNHFKNVLTQEVRTVQLLPVRPQPGTATADGPAPRFEPDQAVLLGHLLPVALESTLTLAMFDSIAAEIAARRTAMNSATDNASGLIGELTLSYNRERQAAITKELMEIIGGAEALKG